MKPVIVMTDSKGYRDNRVTVHHFPLIGIEPCSVRTDISHHYDWLILTSANAVEVFFANYRHITFEHIAAVGPKTRAQIENYGYAVDFVPESYTQEGLIQKIPELFVNRTIMLPVSKKARPDLIEHLKSSCDVTHVTLYEPVTYVKNSDKMHDYLLHHNADWVTFMSPSAVDCYYSTYGHEGPLKVNVMAIGHVTGGALEKYGQTYCTSERETKESMIETILKKVDNNEL